MTNSKTDAGGVSLLPCPFCGSEIRHVERWAKSFYPPRLYHEWHHDETPCQIHYPQGGTMIANATNDPTMQAHVIKQWNTRSTPVRCDGPVAAEDWKNDPTADERWNAGCDFAMLQLCNALEVDPESVSWDAATETVNGDVSAVVGNIMRAKYGEEWSAASVPVESGWVATPARSDAATTEVHATEVEETIADHIGGGETWDDESLARAIFLKYSVTRRSAFPPPPPPPSGVREALGDVRHLLKRIDDLMDDDDAAEPLDDAIAYARRAMAIINRALQLPAADEAGRQPDLSDGSRYSNNEIAQRMWQTFNACGDRWFKYAAQRLESSGALSDLTATTRVRSHDHRR